MMNLAMLSLYAYSLSHSARFMHSAMSGHFFEV